MVWIKWRWSINKLKFKLRRNCQDDWRSVWFIMTISRLGDFFGWNKADYENKYNPCSLRLFFDETSEITRLSIKIEIQFYQQTNTSTINFDYWSNKKIYFLKVVKY